MGAQALANAGSLAINDNLMVLVSLAFCDILQMKKYMQMSR